MNIIAQSHVGPVIPVSDLDRSIEFFEQALGLPGEEVPGGYALTAGQGTRIFLLPSTDYPGKAAWPLASFRTDDLDGFLADLRERGVEPVSIDEGEQETDENGIADLDGLRIAWFCDPDDQVYSVFQPKG